MDINKVKSILRWTFFGIIGLYIVLIYVHHWQHPELYTIVVNTSDEYNPLAQDCECQEKVALNTLIGWIQVLRWFMLPMAIIWIIIFFLEKPELIEKFKRIGE